MSTNGITTQRVATTIAQRRNLYISGLLIRTLIALVISWIIVMTFFGTGVISH